jgi:hypothetical protein
METPLSAALKQLGDIVEQMKPIDARIAKLERLTQSSSPAASEKAALHSDHEHSLKAWVANPESDMPPTLDADRLSRLDAEIRAHESSKASANDGLRALIAARSKLLDEHRVASAAAHLAATEHVIAEMLPEMIDALNKAHKVLVETKDRIDNAYRFLMAEGARLANTAYNARAERLWNEVKAKTVTPVSREDYTPFRDALNAILLPKSEEIPA